MEDDLREEEMRIIALDYASTVFQGAAHRRSESSASLWAKNQGVPLHVVLGPRSCWV